MKNLKLRVLSLLLKNWLLAGALAFYCFSSHVKADSTITIPVPESIESESKNLVITISIPSKLEKKREQLRKEGKDKPRPKKIDMSYFDLDPFPLTATPKDIAILRRLADLNLIDPTVASVIKMGYITNDYEIARTISIIVNILKKTTVEELGERMVTRKDLNDFLALFDKYRKLVYTMGHHPKDRDYIARLASALSYTDGEVKVVKVETDEAGGTVIHLTLRGQDNFEPVYITRAGTTENNLVTGESKTSQVSSTAQSKDSSSSSGTTTSTTSTSSGGDTWDFSLD